MIKNVIRNSRQFVQKVLKNKENKRVSRQISDSLRLLIHLKELQLVILLLLELSPRLSSHYLVKLAFIDKFNTYGWKRSTVEALSKDALGEFLNVANFNPSELERHFEEVFETLAGYSKSDLSNKSVVDLISFIRSNEQRFCSTLSLFKASHLGLNSSFWYELFSDQYGQIKKPSIKLIRRFTSFMVAHYHLEDLEPSNSENSSLLKALKRGGCDLSDIAIISQNLWSNEIMGFIKSNEFKLDISQDIKSNLVQANLNNKKYSVWTEYVNRYLTVFDISLIKKVDSTGFGSIEFEPVAKCECDSMVSIAVPAFNAEETIEVSINSLLFQSYSNIEIIVVDDASTDRTCDIVERISAKDSRVRLIRNKINAGPYLCRNIALKFAEGKYFTVNDADDISHPERIADHVSLIIESGAFAVESRLLRLSDNLVFISDAYASFLRKNPSSLFFDRLAMLHEFGYWDCVRYGADTELFARLERANKKIVLSPKPYMVAKYSVTSLSVSQNNVFKGPSGNRRTYSKAFANFHKNIDNVSKLKYAFVHNREFVVPIEMEVHRDIVNEASLL